MYTAGTKYAGFSLDEGFHDEEPEKEDAKSAFGSESDASFPD